MSERHSQGRKRMLSDPGYLYAAYSRGECWIKVGFSLNVPRRLGTLNSRFKQLAPFTLIGATLSLYRAERQIHRILLPFRDFHIGLSRELYLAVPALESAVKMVVAGVDRPPMDWRDVSDCVKWSRAQARPIRDDIRHFYRVARQANFREVLE